jgi:hypothetical protein
MNGIKYLYPKNIVSECGIDAAVDVGVGIDRWEATRQAGGVANSADAATRHAPRKSTEPHEPSDPSPYDLL